MRCVKLLLTSLAFWCCVAGDDVLVALQTGQGRPVPLLNSSSALWSNNPNATLPVIIAVTVNWDNKTKESHVSFNHAPVICVCLLQVL